MRELIVEWLRAEGYSVRIEEERSRNDAGGADLVIVDLYMPRSAGSRRLLCVQSAFPGVPVVAISGQFCPGLAADGTAARALGARQLIAKPFSRAQLLKAVRAIAGAASERSAER